MSHYIGRKSIYGDNNSPLFIVTTNGRESDESARRINAEYCDLCHQYCVTKHSLTLQKAGLASTALHGPKEEQRIK